MQATRRCAADPLLFTLSIAIAITASVVALWIAFQLRSETILSAFWKKAGAQHKSWALRSPECTTTGMAAAVFAPNTICRPQDISNLWLASAIGGSAYMFRDRRCCVSVFDAHPQTAPRSMRKPLRDLNVDLETGRRTLRSPMTRLQKEFTGARAFRRERMYHLAYHDSLTSLPNRSLFSQLLTHGISQAHSLQKGLAVPLSTSTVLNISMTRSGTMPETCCCRKSARDSGLSARERRVARLGETSSWCCWKNWKMKNSRVGGRAKILSAIVKPFGTPGLRSSTSRRASASAVTERRRGREVADEKRGGRDCTREGARQEQLRVLLRRAPMRTRSNASHWKSTCGARWSATNFRFTTSPKWIFAAVRSRAWKR